MQILPNTPLDDEILRILLRHGEQEAGEIMAALKINGRPATMQAIYKRARHLIAGGILIKNRQLLLISNEWRQAMLEMLGDKSGVPNLRAGESLTYSFKSLASLDAYWKHLATLLEQDFPGFPVFFYNPYEIWISLPDRRESEDMYLRRFNAEERYCFFLLGKAVAANEEFKKHYSASFLQVSVGRELLPERDYAAIIGDYVITTRLSPGLAASVAKIFKNTPDCIPGELGELFVKKTSIKLKVERKSAKATNLRKRIAQDFFIPKEVKDKFSLF